MRLDASAAGAVAYIVAGAAARTLESKMEARETKRIAFRNMPQYLHSSDEDFMVSWSIESTSEINITNAFLYNVTENGLLDLIVKTGSPSVQSGQFFLYNLERMNVFATFGVKDPQVYQVYKYEGLIDTALCLCLDWSDETGFNKLSFSPAFAIISDSNLTDPSFDQLHKTMGKTPSSRYIGKEVQKIGDLPQKEGPSSPNAAAASALPAMEDNGNNGLSVAAQAGIGVGVSIAGLLLIGALVFFCLRRRRRRNQKPYDQGAGAGFASDSGIKVMVRDKEMPGVNQSSPHSLYASDGGRLHDQGTPIDSSVVGNGDRPSYAGGEVERTYDDREPAVHNDAAAAVTRTMTHTSHGASRPTSEVRSPSRYAHLIEEGMTENEIRRLEEEERQLDAAIENAGRQSRST